MATVRFSKVLKEEIERKARRMFDKELDIARANTPPTWTGEYLYNSIIPQEIRDTMNKLPSGYFPTSSKIILGGVVNVPEGEDKQLWYSEDAEFALPTALPMPQGSDFDGWNKSWRAVTINHGVPRFATLQAEYKGWVDKVQAVLVKRDTFVAGVDKITSTYASLKPALKVFPALWDLVPEEYRQKHLQVTSRKASAIGSELGDLDVDSMTAAVTLNKLTR